MLNNVEEIYKLKHSLSAVRTTVRLCLYSIHKRETSCWSILSVQMYTTVSGITI